MAIVATTVVTMIIVAEYGIRRSVLGVTLCQSIVPTDTMIMTATSAAMGIMATTGPSPTTKMRRKMPAEKVERRVRARPSFTLMIV